MDCAVDRSAALIPAILDRELGLIRAAIAMVASKATSRVVVAGLWFGEQLLEPATRLAGEAGVRLVPMWRADEMGADVTIETAG